MKRKQSIESVRWDLALRYRLIETVAWWEGRLTTGHLMQSFGISRQQASKDINTYITEHAPKNLTYDKHLKGYVPSLKFSPKFIDNSASAYLHLLSQNKERAPHIEGLALAYAHTEVLKVPDRSVRPEVLRPLVRACREGLRLECEYVSRPIRCRRHDSSLRTPSFTPACAGMSVPSARRIGTIVTSSLAVSVANRMYWMSPKMDEKMMWVGPPK